MTFENKGRRGRVTIGIYNAYDPKTFREPHRRIIARAGDLAMAFNMNLALFGFPIPEDKRTPKEIADFIAGTTMAIISSNLQIWDVFRPSPSPGKDSRHSWERSF